MSNYDTPQEAVGRSFYLPPQGSAAPDVLSAADTSAEYAKPGEDTESIDFGEADGFLEEDESVQAGGYIGEDSPVKVGSSAGVVGIGIEEAVREGRGEEENGYADEAEYIGEEDSTQEAEMLQPEAGTEETVFRLAYRGGEIPLSAAQLEAAARRGLDYAREQIQTQQRTKPYFDLIERYPELREAKNMPQEVLAEIGSGAAPLAAYQA